MSQQIGYISQIIGPVVDVHFPLDGRPAEEVLPHIHDALEVQHPDGRTLVIEVQQHIGDDVVRTVAMDNRPVHPSPCPWVARLKDVCST